MSSKLRTPDQFRLWGSGSFAHICFESPGCRFRKAGYCVMCDYGAGSMLSPEQAVTAIQSATVNWGKPIKRLLLGTCGSIFDEREMLPETLSIIVGEIKKTEIESIIFETHYSFVTEELLRKLAASLPCKRIAIELGFESSDPEVLEKSLHKYMNLEDLSEAISLIRSFNMSSILNVFLGAPGLTTAQQLEDSIRSVHWAFAHGADEVVIFPANIKPGTALWRDWESGRYELPSSWLLVELLRRLPKEELETTSISWYGDRQFNGVDTDILAPACCEHCCGELYDFYCSFMEDFRADIRIRLISELVGKCVCSCYNDLMISLRKG